MTQKLMSFGHQVFNDVHDRYYWAAPSHPPRYNTRARIEANNPPWLLGITTPTVPPGVTASGGASSTTVTRSYVYTWISAYGEEGAPSPPTVVTGKTDDAWSITLTAAAAGDLGVNRNLTKTRIYRTVTSDQGVATYFMVVELPIATLSYSDTLGDPVVTLNQQLQSDGWTPPPSDLEGFIVMPNGIVAGWRANELWMSEPYRPHAWPAAYCQTVEYPIVGMGIANQTLVICTQGLPVTASGVSPAYIKQSKLTNFEPCMSRGSILSVPAGVFYASPNGLVQVTPGQAANVTFQLINKDKWIQLVPVSTLRAVRFGMAYYAYGTGRPGVFEDTAFNTTDTTNAFTDEDFSGAYNGILIDVSNQRVAFNLLKSVEPIINVHNDPWSGEVFVLKTGKVYWIDQTDPMQPCEPYRWKSKLFTTAEPMNLGALQIRFDAPAWIVPGDYGIVRVFADKVEVTNRPLVKSGQIMRLPSGFKADLWQLQIESKVQVKKVHLASSINELRNA